MLDCHYRDIKFLNDPRKFAFVFLKFAYGNVSQIIESIFKGTLLQI